MTSDWKERHVETYLIPSHLRKPLNLRLNRVKAIGEGEQMWTQTNLQRQLWRVNQLHTCAQELQQLLISEVWT